MVKGTLLAALSMVFRGLGFGSGSRPKRDVRPRSASRGTLCCFSSRMGTCIDATVA